MFIRCKAVRFLQRLHCCCGLSANGAKETPSLGGTIPSACHPVGMLHVDGALAYNLLCDLCAGCFPRLDFGPGWTSNVRLVSLIEFVR